MTVKVLYLVKYENDQKAAMLKSHEMRERAQIHRKAIADFGGVPIAQYATFGEYDMVYIYEMKDNAHLAANLHLTDSFGLAKYSKAIILMSNEEMTESMIIAAETKTEYSPAT